MMIPTRESNANSIMKDRVLHEEVEQLKAEVATLEELLEVYQRSVLEQSDKLEQALEKLQEHAQQLERSEEALQVLKSILDSMGDGVVVANESGKFLLFNPAAEKLLGNSLTDISPYEWTERYGLYLPDKLTPYPSQEFPLVRAIQGEIVDAAETFVHHSQLSEGIWLSVNARPLKDENDISQGGVAVFRDITNHKRSEEALQQSEARSRQQAQQLEQALQELRQTQSQLIHTEKMSSLGQLVAGVAHEINNPVNFISGNLNHVREYTQDLLALIKLYQQHYPSSAPEIQDRIEEIDLNFITEDLPKILSSMKSGASRIHQIVVSLRSFSHLDEAGLKPIDIHQGIDNTLNTINHRLNSEIKVIKKYGNLPKIDCYPAQLNQVFLNIINNAIDALQESKQDCKQIVIETQNFDINQIKVSIKDNGSGIPLEIQSKLFDPFFTTKPVGQGSGLGLSICYQIIEKHSGSIEVISELGGGTEFIISLPVKLPDIPQ